MPRSITSTMVTLLCVAALWCPSNAVAKSKSSRHAADPVALSFAFFGCNRLDQEGVKATGSASTANVAQLLQSFQDIAVLPQLPRYVFLAGDIVKAKKPGTQVLAQQLAAWVTLATDPRQNPLLHKRVPIVAFTGNHELLVNQEDSDCKYAQCPNPPAWGCRRYWL